MRVTALLLLPLLTSLAQALDLSDETALGELDDLNTEIVTQWDPVEAGLAHLDKEYLDDERKAARWAEEWESNTQAMMNNTRAKEKEHDKAIQDSIATPVKDFNATKHNKIIIEQTKEYNKERDAEIIAGNTAILHQTEEQNKQAKLEGTQAYRSSHLYSSSISQPPVYSNSGGRKREE